MIYLINQDWSNTSNNHAGIKYLCKQLESLYPDSCKAIVIPDFFSSMPCTSNLLLRELYKLIAQYKFYKFIKYITDNLLVTLKGGDEIYLMEYMELMYPQYKIAQRIKHNFPHIRISVMVHLVPKRLSMSFSNKDLQKWTKPIDRIIILGSSLKKYFEKRGVPTYKLCTTFHYVDRSYYNCSRSEIKDPVRVIAMGNQMRNVDLLKEVVQNNPKVKFIICQGVCDLSKKFFGLKNVKLIPFVSEMQLKEYMENADISLNVMEDTIGSNVIVTSMAMGLAMIVSDVGSIHDYCNEKNAIFCSNDDVNSFTKAISKLENNKELLKSMQLESCFLSKKLTIEAFYNQVIKK